MPAAAPPRDPQTDRTRLETLVQTLQAGRYDDGLRLAEAALADGLIHPLPLRLTASALQQAGRFEEAIARFQHAVDLAPQDPGGWAALSACLFMARRPTAALAASQAALDLAPNEPALLCGRAQLLQSLGRVDEAQGLYERALEIDPQLFEAALGLAGLAIEAGDWVEADRLTRGLIQRHGRVSVERLLSGPGLATLYETLNAIEGVDTPALAPNQITHRAIEGDELCRAALSRFCAILGTVAGDLALAFGARGGVYVTGGIDPVILEFLRASTFRNRFEAKGRMSEYVQTIPTRVIVRPDAALVGAASLLNDLEA